MHVDIHRSDVSAVTDVVIVSVVVAVVFSAFTWSVQMLWSTSTAWRGRQNLRSS